MQSTRLTFAQNNRTSERPRPRLMESSATARSSFARFPPCALYRRDRRSLLQAGEPFIPVRPCRQPNTRSSRLMRTASFRDIEPVFKHFQRQASPCIRILTPSNGHKTVRGVSCWGGYKGPCRHVLKIDLKPFVPTQTARQEETILSQPKLPI